MTCYSSHHFLFAVRKSRLITGLRVLPLFVVYSPFATVSKSMGVAGAGQETVEFAYLHVATPLLDLQRGSLSTHGSVVRLKNVTSLFFNFPYAFDVICRCN